MSYLTVYEDSNPATPLLQTGEATTIANKLAGIGVHFERWESPVALGPDDDAQTILAAYRPYLNALMGATGAGSADVVKLTPDHPAAAELRAKFLQEHTHSEDEIRFFVQGSGYFALHVNGRVYTILCEAGDLLSVPAHAKHWFDAGETPSFTALRVFTDTSGWVAHFTGDDISTRFPTA